MPNYCVVTAGLLAVAVSGVTRATDPPAGNAKAHRGELTVVAKTGSKDGKWVDLHFTLTNKSKDLLINSWYNHRFDGVSITIWGPDGREVKTRAFYDLSMELKSGPDYIVLKPNESRTERVSFLSFIPGGKLPDGKYKVKAVYTNTFQEEKYEAKEIEVEIPIK